MILAEVFRQARLIWPATEGSVDNTVVVRVDVIKELQVPAIRSPATGCCFVLAKTSGRDAAVKILEMSQFEDTDWSQTKVLNFDPNSKPVLGNPRGNRKSF